MANSGYVYLAIAATTCAAFGCSRGSSTTGAGAEDALSSASTARAGTLTVEIMHAVPDSTFADPGAELALMARYAAGHGSTYSFVDTTSAFAFDGNDHGGSATATSIFLGSDASGSAASDSADMGDTIIDAKGFFVASVGGSYRLHLGVTDDAAGIYLGGTGISGSGELEVSNAYTSGTGADATVTLAAGASVTVEILYGNGYGSAGLGGVSIVDPTGTQVTYTTTPTTTEPPLPDAGTDAGSSGSGPAAGTYVLESVAYGQAIAVSQAQSYDGNVLVTYSVNDAPGQQFKVVPSGGGYMLQEQIAGRCLEVDGSNVTIDACSGGAAQTFALTQQGDGAYVVTASDGQCVAAGGTFALVAASACNGATAQLWYFGAVGGTPVMDAGAPPDAGTDAGTPPPDAGGGGGGPPGGVGALPQSFKLMTLGDSMTGGYGGPDIGGYRGPLYQSLVAQGYSPQMVGAQNCGAVSILPAAQQDCDGVGGATIEQTDARVTAGAGLVKTEDPDVVLLLIGFNTVYYETSSIPTDLSLLSKLVDDIMAQKPSARLVVASLIASTQCCGTDLLAQYNAGVPGIVSAKAAQGYPVSFVDLYPVVPPQDLYDYVHPNDTGYSLVASAWLGAIDALSR